MGRYVAPAPAAVHPGAAGHDVPAALHAVLSIQINGNPVRALFGDRQPPPETLAAITRAFGLDDPASTQTGNPCSGMFVDRLAATAAGDFGVDFNQQPVST